MQRRHLFYSTTVIILSAALSACATLPAPQAAADQQITWQARKAQLNQIRAWTINGAIGVRTPKGGGSANVYWQQRQRKYTMDLSGPLGSGAIKLVGSPNHIKLVKSATQQYTASNAEQLILEQTGWRIPVSNLYYWIRGLPAPTGPAITRFDKFHHLRHLQQQGWSITYQRYTAVKRIDLPSKLTLSKPPFRLRIVISRWQL